MKSLLQKLIFVVRKQTKHSFGWNYYGMNAQLPLPLPILFGKRLMN